MTSPRRSSAEGAGAQPALRRLGPENLALWERLGTAVRQLLSPSAFRRYLPGEIGAWTRAEQRAWIEAAIAIAPRAARTALTVYRQAPTAVGSLPPALRAPVLDLLRVAAPAADPMAVEALVPLLGVLVLDVEPARRAETLAVARSVGEACPAAVPGLLRALARIADEAPGERLAAWAARGLEIARAHPEAARAYFALESRTSLRVLRASPTAATLPEVEGVLHRYVQMLSGARAFVRDGGTFRLRAPIEESPAEGGVALPATIDILDEWEANARLYRVLAALLAGRREFGTYAMPDLAAYLRAEERPAALEECFLLADGYRVARRLAATYPGIAAELGWAARALLASWCETRPSPALLLDALLAQAIAPGTTNLPWWATGAAAVALPCLAPLDHPGATAREALAIADLIAGLLSLPFLHEGVEPTVPTSAEFYLGGAEDGEPSPGGEATGPGGTPMMAPPAEELPPELLAQLELHLGELAEHVAAAGRPLTAQELARLLEAGLLPQLRQQMDDAQAAQAGLYVTQLTGKLLGQKLARRQTGARSASPRPHHPPAEDGPVFLYDEWDHVIVDYRPAWCELREVALGDDAGFFFTTTLERYAPLVPEIRRHFQRVRPESWRIVRGLEDGDDFDLAAAVDARAEQRARRSPSPKLYTAHARREREVATLFLLDMSASTDEAADVEGARRRIIDIEKEALVIMAAALEELGDTYAIYGFSGQGRHHVEFYPIKSFTERLAAGGKGRIGGIEPRCSTRMGTALRHSLRQMRDVRAPNRHLILISDGFPQDLDYGEDRRSYAYGISDTAVALREVEAARIKPFCITVDLAGHDYLREMCDPQRYMVIENVADLPRELPKIYQRLVRAA